VAVAASKADRGIAQSLSTHFLTGQPACVSVVIGAAEAMRLDGTEYRVTSDRYVLGVPGVLMVPRYWPAPFSPMIGVPEVTDSPMS
jgi:hypothetical protein